MSSPYLISWPCLRFVDVPNNKVSNQHKPPTITNPKSKPIFGISTDTTKTTTNEPSKTSIVSKTTVSPDTQLDTTQKQPKTFAQALSNVCDIPTSQLPQPVLKGDNYAITIPDDEVDAGINSFKFNLHARVIWPKGTIAPTAVALRYKLSQIWKNLSKWVVTSIAKGYFEFSFPSLEDVKRVISTSSWNLNPGVLKLFSWTRDFNPKVQNTTSTQVWLRIYGLPQEYWRPRILFSIANSVRTPICTGPASTKPMMERTFGHFARVLVDMDITQQLRYEVLVERKDYAFFVDLVYENLPEFCTHCLKIWHHVDDCRFLTKPNDVPDTKKQLGEVRKVFQVSNDGRKKQGNQVNDPIVVEDVADTSKKKSSASLHTGAVENQNKTSGTEVQPQINRFEVLAQKEAEAYKDKDVELEDEVNAKLDEENNEDVEDYSSTHETEFVDNTQYAPILERIDNDDQPVDNTNVLNMEKERLLEIENKNKEFLQDSWENIVNDEAIEQIFLKQLEEDPQDGFQVVSRSKGKLVKKKTPIKSDYATIFKSGNTEPFK